MFHYRVKIAYKGTNYQGWQAQSVGPQDPLHPTVQGTIDLVLRKIARYRPCAVQGTSRTDAGVHAAGQLGKLSLPTHIPPGKLLLGMNALLPQDIRLLEVEDCNADFNPKTAATSKEYHYYFSSNDRPNPALADVIAHVPGPLRIELMRKAAAVFVGEHDFRGFSRGVPPAANTVRRVLSCEVDAGQPCMASHEVFKLRVSGVGFLKQMVRYMASAIIAAGSGEVAPAQITRQLEEPGEEKLCVKAAANGLHLFRID